MPPDSSRTIVSARCLRFASCSARSTAAAIPNTLGRTDLCADVDRAARGSRTPVHRRAQLRPRACHALRIASQERGVAMPSRAPQIVALGGGGFSMETDSPLLDDYALSLTGSARPRVCFLPTASGDADHYIVRFYRRFPGDFEASHVSLFRRDRGTGG